MYASRRQLNLDPPIEKFRRLAPIRARERARTNVDAPANQNVVEFDHRPIAIRPYYPNTRRIDIDQPPVSKYVEVLRCRFTSTIIPFRC